MYSPLEFPPRPIIKTFEGMEDADSMMRRSVDEGMQMLLENNETPPSIFPTNGFITLLVHFVDRVHTLRDQGKIDSFKADEILSRVVYAEAIKSGSNGRSSIEQMRYSNEHLVANSHNAIVFDDIADELHVHHAVAKDFPDGLKTITPVMKVHTPVILGELQRNGLRHAEVHADTIVDNEWILSSCGMNDGKEYPGATQEQIAYLQTLERFAQRGVIEVNGAQPSYDEMVAYFQEQLLPWVSPQDSLFQLVQEMELAKMDRDIDSLFQLSEQVIPSIQEHLANKPLTNHTPQVTAV